MSRHSLQGAGLVIVVAVAMLVPAAADVLQEWQITLDPGEDTSVDWSADGTLVIYDHWTGSAAYDIWRIPAAGGSPTPLVTGPGSQSTAEWSSLDQLVFSSDHAGNNDIYAMPATGGDVSTATQITSDPANDSWPTWSPDGTLIAFQSNRSGNWDIWIVPADGSEPPTQFTVDTGDDRWPTWSPFGEAIAFSSTRSDQWSDIWIKPYPAGDPRLVQHHGTADYNPDWSPDGDLIAYTAYTAVSEADIWAVSADGSGDPQQMTFFTGIAGGNGVDDQAAWSPDGQAMAYHTPRSGNWDIWACVFDPIVTAVSTPNVPQTVLLGQNDPNPFNPTTRIEIRAHGVLEGTRLDFFNAMGRRVRSIPVADGGPSVISVVWDGRNDRGQVLPSGTYFYKLTHAGGVSETRKAILLK